MPFGPWQADLLRKRTTDSGTRKDDEGNAHKFEARWGGTRKGPREALNQPLTSFMEPKKEREPSSVGRPQALAPAALGRNLPTGSLVQTLTSLLKHGPAVGAPKSSGGDGFIFILHSSLPQCVPAPHHPLPRVMYEQQRCSGVGGGRRFVQMIQAHCCSCQACPYRHVSTTLRGEAGISIPNNMTLGTK